MLTTGIHGRPVWTIASDAFSVTVTECGAHVAEVTSKKTGVNPLWIQDRQTIDSDLYDPVVHGALYGLDTEGKTIAGLLGHNLCLPYWGSPTESEFHAGMTCHGETNVTRWRALEHTSKSLKLEAHLKESSLRVERTLHCRGNFLAFETVVENLSAWDRPLGWCEHVSYGPPFLAAHASAFYADLGRGFRTAGNADDDFCWPVGRGTIGCDLTQFSEQPHSDLVNSFLVETEDAWATFAGWNAGLGCLLGYAFRVAEFPWLNVWENNDPRRQTRGMEFSNTPIEGTMRALMATPLVYGVPTFEWLEAQAVVRKGFYCFSVDIPATYRGIERIRFDGVSLSIREVETGCEATFSSLL